MKQSVNQRVKMLRKELRLTQSEFGEKLGFSQANITSMENGTDSKGVTVESVQKICEVFKVDPEWLVEGTGPMLKGEAPVIKMQPPAEGTISLSDHARIIQEVVMGMIEKLKTGTGGKLTASDVSLDLLVANSNNQLMRAKTGAGR